MIAKLGATLESYLLPSGVPTRLYYSGFLYCLFDCLMPIYAVYTIMFAHHGATPQSISLLFAVWCVAGMLLEIPSGTLGDKYSRKHLIAVGQFCRALGYVVWAVWPTFFGFALGFVLWAVRNAFNSGTYDAWLYDELDASGRTDKYIILSSVYMAVSYGAMVLGAVLASLLSGWGYQSILIFSAMSGAFAGIVALSFPERISVMKSRNVVMKEQVQNTFSVLKHTAALPSIIIVGAILGPLIEIVGDFYPIVMDMKGLDYKYIGFLVGLVCLGSFLGGILADKFKQQGLQLIPPALIIGGLLLFLIADGEGMWRLSLLPVFAALAQFVLMLNYCEMQDRIPSNIRATAISFKQAFANATSCLLFFVFGALSEQIGLEGAIIVFSALLILMSLIQPVGQPITASATVVTETNRVIDS